MGARAGTAPWGALVVMLSTCSQRACHPQEAHTQDRDKDQNANSSMVITGQNLETRVDTHGLSAKVVRQQQQPSARMLLRDLKSRENRGQTV